MKQNHILKAILVIVLLAFVQVAFSQNYKFGKVSKEELAETVYPLDSSDMLQFYIKKENQALITYKAKVLF